MLDDLLHGLLTRFSGELQHVAKMVEINDMSAVQF